MVSMLIGQVATEVDDEMFHPFDNHYRACDVQ